MRISKALASTISRAALAFRDEEVEKEEKEYSDLVDVIAFAAIPEEVKEFAKKYRSYLDFSDTPFLTVEGQKLNRRYEVSMSLPCVSQGYNSYVIYITAEDKVRIEKKELKLQKLRDKLSDDVQTLYNTILALSTKKRVLEELPDLQPYFPAEITTALAPNLSAVRDLLKR